MAHPNYIQTFGHTNFLGSRRCRHTGERYLLRYYADSHRRLRNPLRALLCLRRLCYLYDLASIIEAEMRISGYTYADFNLRIFTYTNGNKADSHTFHIIYCDRFTVCTDVPYSLREKFLTTLSNRHVADLVDISVWKTDGSILDLRNIISLRYSFYGGWYNVKLLTSGECRRVRYCCIFRHNDLEVFL